VQQQAHLLSKAPDSIQPGKAFPARIEHIKAGKMTLSTQPAGAKQAPVQLVSSQISGAKEGQNVRVTMLPASGSSRSLLTIEQPMQSPAAAPSVSKGASTPQTQTQAFNFASLAA